MTLNEWLSSLSFWTLICKREIETSTWGLMLVHFVRFTKCFENWKVLYKEELLSLASSTISSIFIFFTHVQVLAIDLRHASASFPLPTLNISSFLLLWSQTWETFSTRITIKILIILSKMLAILCSTSTIYVLLFPKIKRHLNILILLECSKCYYINILKYFLNVNRNYRSGSPCHTDPSSLLSLLCSLNHNIPPHSKLKWRAVTFSNAREEKLCVRFTERWVADLQILIFLKDFSKKF